MGTAVTQWLRCCATNRKVAGSIPGGVIGIFIDIKSFRSHYGPGVDSASNRNEYQEYFRGGKGGRYVKLATCHHPVPLSRNLGALNSLNPLGLSRPVMGLIYLHILYIIMTCGRWTPTPLYALMAWTGRSLPSIWGMQMFNNFHQTRAFYRLCGISQYMQGGYTGHGMYNSTASCLLKSNVRSDKQLGSCGREAVVRVPLRSAPFLFTCSPNKIVGTDVSGTSQYQI